MENIQTKKGIKGYKMKQEKQQEIKQEKEQEKQYEVKQELELDAYMFDELKDAFEFFDVNGDGHICGKELGNVLRALGQNPTEQNIKELLKEADKDGDQVITYDEYIKLLQNRLKDKNVVEIELREAFRVFDKNRDGNLNFKEMQRALMSVGDDFLTLEESEQLCKLMDKNGDGKVDVEEFVKYMCRRY